MANFLSGIKSSYHLTFSELLKSTSYIIKNQLIKTIP